MGTHRTRTRPSTTAASSHAAALVLSISAAAAFSDDDDACTCAKEEEEKVLPVIGKRSERAPFRLALEKSGSTTTKSLLFPPNSTDKSGPERRLEVVEPFLTPSCGMQILSGVEGSLREDLADAAKALGRRICPSRPRRLSSPPASRCVLYSVGKVLTKGILTSPF